MATTFRSKQAKLLPDSSASSSKEPSSATINDLPSEMLVRVFSYLDKTHLLNSVPQVCKRWETLHSDPSLYGRRFTFSERGPSKGDAIKLLSNAAHWLKSLDLYGRSDTDAILACVAVSNPRLETLSLRYCNATETKKAISSVSLRGVLDNCNLLQHLSLYGSYCRSRKVYNEIGLRLPSLRSVALGNPKRFDSQALMNIAANCPNLEEIKATDCPLINNSITNHTVSFLCNQLQYLKSVEIASENCTDKSVFALAKCRQLTNLRLEDAWYITNVGIMAISEMPSIVKLELSHNDQISTSCWSDFFKKPIMRRLQRLSLHLCTNVTEAQRNMIIAKPFDLRELYLSNGVLLRRHYRFAEGRQVMHS